MAARLIDSFYGRFDPAKYEDTFRDTLCKMIEAKRKGKEVHVAADHHEDEGTPDLMERPPKPRPDQGKAPNAEGGAVERQPQPEPFRQAREQLERPQRDKQLEARQ